MTNDSLIMTVREALKAITDPISGVNIVAGGRISGLSVKNGVARYMVDASGWDQAMAMTLMEETKKAVDSLPQIDRVAAVATSHNTSSSKLVEKTQATPRPQSARPSGHDNPMGLKKTKPSAPNAPILPGVKNVIAIASGKGGVGKSTMAANLAVAFAKAGYKTGLLDADIYGPSLPTLFGITGKPQMRDGKIVPIEKFGVKAMSIGLLVNADQALAWRGPMVMGAVRQLLNDVDWGALDVIFIDTPPGTGDAHLSLAQTKRLTGAVIVSTPQEMALADVRRGVSLFRKVEVPILGVIENMAWLESQNGERTYLFGEGGAEQAAIALDAPFLGAIPIYPELRIASDEGTPLVASKANNNTSNKVEEIFSQLANTIAESFTQ